MIDSELTTWMNGHGALFPDWEAWRKRLDSEHQSRVRTQWVKDFADVRLSDAIAASEQLHAGEDTARYPQHGRHVRIVVRLAREIARSKPQRDWGGGGRCNWCRGTGLVAIVAQGKTLEICRTIYGEDREASAPSSVAVACTCSAGPKSGRMERFDVHRHVRVDETAGVKDRLGAAEERLKSLGWTGALREALGLPAQAAEGEPAPLARAILEAVTMPKSRTPEREREMPEWAAEEEYGGEPEASDDPR